MSANPGFIHLRVRSPYSMLEGAVQIGALCDWSVKQGMPALGLTDSNNLCGGLEFSEKLSGKGVQPIIGCTLSVDLGLPLQPGEIRRDPDGTLVLLAQNETGYINLMTLSSSAFLDIEATDHPHIKADLLEKHSEGVIALTGGHDGALNTLLIAGREDVAADWLDRLSRIYDGRLYIEIQRHGRPEEAVTEPALLDMAYSRNLPIVATNEPYFYDRHMYTAHDALLAINEGSYVLEKDRRKLTREHYLKTADEMADVFFDLPEALDATIEIAKRCAFKVYQRDPILPNFGDGSVSEGDILADQAREGLEGRLAHLERLGEMAESREDYFARLDFELGVIRQMGFPGYFLIVSDFIKWAKEQGIPVGPGRGSGAGSVVAWALLITDLDPLRYGLLFERFLNPERVSMPDFDIDFCMDGRDRVIQYVAQKYGAHRVSQIITYGTMAAKAVVRDVGRIMSHPYFFVDSIAKMVPFEVGMTLTKAMAESEDLKRAYDTDEEVTALLDMALSLEGLSRNCGKHAGGVVIAPTALTDFAPLYCEPDGSSLVTQFDKDDAEEVGLVKFDFLGLRTLTIIDNAVKQIQKHSTEKLDLLALPLDDAPTYKLLQDAQTTAVFQLESPGMKRLIERLRPDNFEDIIALVALYRPGPLQSGMVDDFIDRKHGRKKMSFPHEDYQLESLQPILEPTYGVILYQEQVMGIAQVMAKFSLGTADILRRAMGKKKPEEMAKQRAVFLEGCAGNGIDKDLAGNIFDLVEKFAGYGFNKSHSAAYALLSYQTAWLKCHHPAAFMSAVMSADMDNTEKVVGLIDECKIMGLTVESPDINRSAVRFSVIDDKTVLYGLGAIKGVGEAALASVLEARDASGAFQSLDDLCRRAGPGTVNKRVLEALVKAGAVDSLGPNRASLWQHLPSALRGADQCHKNKAAGMDDLFGLGNEVEEQTPELMVTVTDWSDRERLRAEKDTLGLYLSGHPINEYLEEIGKFTHGRLKAICAKAGTGDSGPSYRQRGVPVVAAGLVMGVRQRDGQGGRMQFVTIDDGTGRIEITLRGEQIDDYGPRIVKDEVLIVDGDVSPDEFNGGYKIRAREIYDLGSARGRFARQLLIRLDSDQWREKGLDELIATLSDYKSGTIPVWFSYRNGDAEARIRAGNRWAVTPQLELLANLHQLTGKDNVELVY